MKSASLVVAVAAVAGLTGAILLWCSVGPAQVAAVDPSVAVPTSAALPAAQVLPDLLAQIYKAFALQDEAAIYDALAVAVTGDAVTALYLQRRRAQVADHAEDGETQITGVEVYDIQPRADVPDGFHVAWRVVGRVRHITHIHERINLYAADLALAPVGGLWKLTGFTLTQSSRETDLNFEGGE